MNAQPKSKHLRGVLSTDASRCVRPVIRTKRPAPGRQSAEPNRPLAAPDRFFHPARGLMICLGWLRLLQAIVSGAIPGRLVNTVLGPHERTPSWEGKDVFSVCDVLPFPKILKPCLKTVAADVRRRSGAGN